MDEISNSVLAYYKDHFDELEQANQFHLASRLFLWNQDSWAKEALDKLKLYFTCNNNPVEALLVAAKAESGIERANAASLRRPYFEKYPNLRVFSRVFFKANFLSTIYGIDAWKLVLSNFDPEEMRILSELLLNDPEAVAILSTFAVNYLYFYSRMIKQDNSLFDPSYFTDVISKQYEMSNKRDIQLMIYLYTHCIIGETVFYYKEIRDKTIYMKMLSELEDLIDQNFSDINLDNKLEFLACARILEVDSRLAGKIYDEASRSLSPDGNFVVDTHNSNIQAERTDINRSEHRNVLLIISSQQYSPLG